MIGLIPKVYYVTRREASLEPFHVVVPSAQLLMPNLNLTVVTCESW